MLTEKLTSERKEILEKGKIYIEFEGKTFEYSVVIMLEPRHLEIHDAYAEFNNKNQVPSFYTKPIDGNIEYENQADLFE